MIAGTFTEDDSTAWFRVWSDNGVHISVKGDFGSGTIALEHKLQGATYPVTDDDQADITYTANFDKLVEFRLHEVIRLTLSGSTNPNLDWSFAGSVR